MPYPIERPRRLRRTPAMRRLVAQTRVNPSDLVLPLFVREGASEPSPIASMPGVMQHTRASMRAAVKDASSAGVGGVMLFGIPHVRDPSGSQADAPDGVLAVAIRDALEVSDGALVVMADLCLDEFTDHGHCGVLSSAGEVDNDATLIRYASMALALAAAGVDVVGTSGMMDGQVGVVREALDDAGADRIAIMGYAAKYASAFYGPFREAVDSQLDGDRHTYQQDPANGLESLREAALDVDEGADIVMVKPAGSYLDIVRQVADGVDVPVAAYQVSGEYSMIEAAAAHGWIDREAAILESLTSIKRAGASIICTYYATEAARLLA